MGSGGRGGGIGWRVYGDSLSLTRYFKKSGFKYSEKGGKRESIPTSFKSRSDWGEGNIENKNTKRKYIGGQFSDRKKY